MTAKVIFTATSDWLQIAERSGLLIDWNADPVRSGHWDKFGALCAFDPANEEVGFAVLEKPRPQDTALKTGDIVAISGPGSDVVFLRIATALLPDVGTD
jgi:hypothetical protein